MSLEAHSNLQATKPQVCGLLAKSPTRLSLAMHSAGFAALKLQFIYLNFDTENTREAFAEMRAKGYRGYSLTIPHKEVGFNLVDELDVDAKKIGAINTVINAGDKLIGYNTDCFGIEEALREAGVSVKDLGVLVLGAGGAARAAVFVVREKGAKSITLCNRNAERGLKLAEEFGINSITESELGKLGIGRYQLIINATPVGSHLGNGELPFLFTELSPQHIVFDFVTKETPLVEAARSAGAKVILGTRMLLYQATRQFELFTGEKAPIQVMEQALLEAMS